MRTTLTIDDDLAAAIERFQASKGLKLREAVDVLLRSGLELVERSPTSKPYEGPVFESKLVPGVDPNRMNQLADELEVEEHLS
ncbi:MAG: hypothetical protein O3B01_28935 [Planctomycetota bacterium]|nr:hypothetical protein [Planctomycetota bacterium]MDA1142609.1 hypothetical protein [Planctomycetota bacterium]